MRGCYSNYFLDAFNKSDFFNANVVSYNGLQITAFKIRDGRMTVDDGLLYDDYVDFLIKHLYMVKS